MCPDVSVRNIYREYVRFRAGHISGHIGHMDISKLGHKGHIMCPSCVLRFYLGLHPRLSLEPINTWVDGCQLMSRNTAATRLRCFLSGHLRSRQSVRMRVMVVASLPLRYTIHLHKLNIFHFDDRRNLEQFQKDFSYRRNEKCSVYDGAQYNQ